MALRKAAISVELREVALRDKPAEMLAISPKATVPVLQCVDGTVIDESLAIMRWALQQSDPGGWLLNAGSPDQQQLLELNDGPFKQALDRYKYSNRHPEDSAENYRRQAESALIESLEKRLQQCSFLGGDSACLTDLAIFPFMRQFAGVDPAWFEQSDWPATRNWLHHWLTHPDFVEVMKKPPAPPFSR